MVFDFSPGTHTMTETSSASLSSNKNGMGFIVTVVIGTLILIAQFT